MTDRISTALVAIEGTDPVKYALRYGVYDANGKLLRYEYIAVDDLPVVEGTPINKKALLTDQTAVILWGDKAPDDPTVNLALAQISELLKEKAGTFSTFELIQRGLI